MATYICSYCGTTSNSPSGGSCSRSPHKTHKWINKDGKTIFYCIYCGATMNNPSGGSCSNSPHKNHEWSPK